MEKLDYTVIMDIPFVNTTRKELLERLLYPRLKNKQSSFVVTANPEIVMETRADAAYKKIVLSADFVVADGIGVVKAAKFMKEPLKERIPGFDLTIDLLALAEREGFRCYFLGAEPAVNKQAVASVLKRFPELVVAGSHHGFFDLADEKLAAEVIAAEPDIIFVALGLPRQEQWIAEYQAGFSKGLFIGVGGSFDVLAGAVKRAPDFWIRLNLEWLYRIIKQPSRLGRIFKVFEFMVRIFLGQGRSKKKARS